MDHYDGEGGRDRSRGSRERGGNEPLEYGRLNSDPDWNHARGRGARSPVSRRTRRSRSPTGTIDRYVPGSPRARRSRSPPRQRYDSYGHLPPATQLGRPSNIDRYVPGQGHGSSAPSVARMDPYKIPMSVTYNYFAEWYRQENGKNGVEITKDEIQAKYDAYKDDLNGRLAKDFVLNHKNDEWFKERYEPEEKEITSAKIRAFRRPAYKKWKLMLDAGGFDNVDRETKLTGAKVDGGMDLGDAVDDSINRGVDDGGMKPVLLIKTISPTVSRVQLEELAETNLPNFHYVSLSDPNPLKKFHRIGFILLKPTDPDDPTSEPASPDESTVELLNGKSIHDDNHGDFVCHVGIHNGPNNPKSKKLLNEYMSMPENLKKEAELIERCVAKLEAEISADDPTGETYDGWELIKDKVEEWGAIERENRETSEEEGEEGADSEVELKILKKKIDLGVEYLRRVYNFCLYCVSSSDSIHELTRKCPGGHIRRPTPHVDYTADQRTFNWTKTWQDKVELFVNPPNIDADDYAARIRKLGGKPVQEAIDEECLKFVKQEDEGKYRCRVEGCTKLFKAEEFWRKHLDKKHPKWLQTLERDAILVNAYVADPTRVHPPKIEQNAQGNFQSGGSGMGNRNITLMPMNFNPGMPGFQPMPGFPAFNPAFMQAQANGNGLMAGVGPIRRRDNRTGAAGVGGLGNGQGRERHVAGQPYVRRDRAEREREREKRDREMREAQARPGRAGSGAGPEMELAVLGRAVKSYKDLDATEAKKGIDELDY